jgi:hypothetical protein
MSTGNAARDLWIYIDESGGEPTKKTQPFRVGVLITGEEISPQIIRAARRKLHSSDRRLPYFHATEDTPPAREAFADSVVASRITGVFLDRGLTSAPVERVYLPQLISSLGQIFLYECSTLKIRIAERGADALAGDEEFVLGQLIKSGMLSLLTHPRLPVRFPRFDIEIRPASEVAGLQVCDLMLWASQRATNRRDRALLTRLGLRKLTHVRVRKTSHSFFSIFYRFGLQGFELLPPKLESQAIAAHDPIPPERQPEARTQIETVVQTCMQRSKSNRSITHIRPWLEIVLLEGKDFAGPATAFMLICHTLPVYPRLMSLERAAALMEFAAKSVLDLKRDELGGGNKMNNNNNSLRPIIGLP